MSNDEILPTLPANGGRRQVERIGDELTQETVDALDQKTNHYCVFVRIYDDESGTRQHSDSCFVFNPDRGRSGRYTGDPDWIFDRCAQATATDQASGLSPKEIADGERRMRERRASRFERPTRVEHVHRIITEPARPPNSIIPTPPRAITGSEWQQLADRFKAIPDSGVRADWHQNSAGEGWRVCGGISRDSAKDCESFCILGGAMLLQSQHIVLSEAARSQSNPVWRWLYYLKDVTSDFNIHLHGLEINELGKEVGPIYGGRIDNLAAVSARVCLECAAHEV